MESDLTDTLSKRLHTSSNMIRIEDVRRSPFQLAYSAKKVFWVTVKEPLQKFFLALHPVENPDIWHLKDQKTSIEILNSLKLKYSTYPEIIDYFRITFEENLYDAVLIEKISGILIQSLFQSDQLGTLETALFAFGRGLAELHLKKIRLTGNPAKKYEKKINGWLEQCLVDYDKIGAPLPKKQCLELIDHLREQANKQPFHLGVIHYDPHPDNFLYNPRTDKLTLLDTDKITYSVNIKGEPVGPIEFDYANVTYDIKKSLDVMDLPDSLIDAFDTPYRRFMGNHVPNK